MRRLAWSTSLTVESRGELTTIWSSFVVRHRDSPKGVGTVHNVTLGESGAL